MIKAPTKEQAEAMKTAGIAYPFLWQVAQDCGGCLIVKHTITGEFRVVEK